jgi:hypothetical protein
LFGFVWFPFLEKLLCVWDKQMAPLREEMGCAALARARESLSFCFVLEKDGDKEERERRKEEKEDGDAR